MNKLLLALIFISNVFLGASNKAYAAPGDLDYFKQFFFKQENLSSDPDFPDYLYRFVLTDFKAKFQMPDGRYLNPVFDIFIFEDGTYRALYRENIFENPEDNHFFPAKCTKMAGKWSIPNQYLILDGIGFVDRAFQDGHHALKVTFTQNINLQGLMGNSVLGFYGQSQQNEGELTRGCW